MIFVDVLNVSDKTDKNDSITWFVAVQTSVHHVALRNCLDKFIWIIYSMIRCIIDGWEIARDFHVIHMTPNFFCLLKIFFFFVWTLFFHEHDWSIRCCWVIVWQISFVNYELLYYFALCDYWSFSLTGNIWEMFFCKKWRKFSK